MAAQLSCRLGDGVPTAVLFEATFHFGATHRAAAAAWRQALRAEAPLTRLEAALSSALQPADAKAPEPTELRQAGAVVAALLDDEPHANLDKKRSGSKAAAHDADAAAAATEPAACSFGLAPPVAKRLAMVLLLSLRDGAAAEERAPLPPPADLAV